MKIPEFVLDSVQDRQARFPEENLPNFKSNRVEGGGEEFFFEKTNIKAYNFYVSFIAYFFAKSLHCFPVLVESDSKIGGFFDFDGSKNGGFFIFFLALQQVLLHVPPAARF